MGTIISSKLKGNHKVVAEVMMDKEEAIQLQGQVDNIHIFSENNIYLRKNISTRGTNDATKYFLLPKKLRKNIRFDKKVSCHKIELKNKVVFIYVAKKH